MSEISAPPPPGPRVKLLSPLVARLTFFIEPNRPQRACPLCRQPTNRSSRIYGITCERCGTDTCSRCYWRAVASPVERLWFKNPQEFNVGELTFLCNGCRS